LLRAVTRNPGRGKEKKSWEFAKKKSTACYGEILERRFKGGGNRFAEKRASGSPPVAPIVEFRAGVKSKFLKKIVGLSLEQTQEGRGNNRRASKKCARGVERLSK